MIRIEEQGTTATGFLVRLEINGSQFDDIPLTHPFGDEAEAKRAELEWYFEDWLNFPTINDARAEQARALLTEYGRGLFSEVFAGAAQAQYTRWFDGTGAQQIEISGSPAFHALHWECLRAPDDGDLKIACTTASIIRKVRTERAHLADFQSGALEIRVLIVTARPGGRGDVAYRTISRPLLDATKNLEGARVRFDLARPGTYKALVAKLEEAREAEKPYHVVHFDLHGAVMGHAKAEEAQAMGLEGMSNLSFRGFPTFEGSAGFLIFEGDTPPSDASKTTFELVQDETLAKLLAEHRVPIAILNACQSAKHLGDSARESSLGARLAAAGAQCVLAMAYSVTVTAAEIMMPALYRALFDRVPMGEAVRRMRHALDQEKARRARFGQTIDLEDWSLPVLYQRSPVTLSPREPTVSEAAELASTAYDDVETTSGTFFGRDLDVLEIERRLCQRNVLLIYGGGGTGKTTLIGHLTYWWQRTGWIEGDPLVFAFDERAWPLDAILGRIAHALLPETEVRLLIGTAKLQARLIEVLRASERLLVLDNLESVTAEHGAIRNTLDEAQCEEIRLFLRALVGGKCRVLLGSRGPVPWLEAQVLKDGRTPVQKGQSYPGYLLRGLDGDAASALAEAILKDQGLAGAFDPERLNPLLRLLAGHPLALHVVLPTLHDATPEEILDKLGGIDLEADDETRTSSILKCVAWSHETLDPDLQALSEVLAPFRGALLHQALEHYQNALREEPPLAYLPLDRLEELLGTLREIGLVHPHENPGLTQLGYVAIQPTLPWFLEQRLSGEGAHARRAAIHRAFRQTMRQLGVEIARLIGAKTPQEQQVGLVLAQTEAENLHAALASALAAQEPVADISRPIDRVLKRTGQKQANAAFADMLITQLTRWEEGQMTPGLSLDRAMVLGDAATALMAVRRLAEAETGYLAVFEDLPALKEVKGFIPWRFEATTYHMLGRVSQEQRDWPTAEDRYQRALAIKLDHNDQHSAASTYHQLGIVAQEQRDWPTAEARYQKALEIVLEHNDPLSAASTYHQLGMVAQEQRDWPTAEERYQKALAIYLKHNDQYEAAGTYHQLGIVAQVQRDWPTAEERYQKALAIYLEHNDQYEAAGTYHQLGMVAQEQRDWPTAEERYQKALAIKLDHNDQHSAASIYHQLGIVAQEQRDWPTAEERYQKALAIYLEHNDPYEASDCHAQLGSISVEHEDWSAATRRFAQALSARHRARDERKTAASLRNLVQVLEAAPDRRAEVVRAVADALEIETGAAENAVMAASGGGAGFDSERLAALRPRVADQLPDAWTQPWSAEPPVLLAWSDLTPQNALEAITPLSLFAAGMSATQATNAPPLPTTRARSAPLPFRPGSQIVEIQTCRLSEAGEGIPSVAALIETETGFVVLDGTSPPIHALNAQTPPSLDEAEARMAYLRFFCAFVRGEEGPFTIVETIDQVTLRVDADPALVAKVAAVLEPISEVPSAPDDPEGSWRYTATVLYAQVLFKVLFRLQPTGMVDMLEDDPSPLADTDAEEPPELPVRPKRYAGPFVSFEQ